MHTPGHFEAFFGRPGGENQNLKSFYRAFSSLKRLLGRQNKTRVLMCHHQKPPKNNNQSHLNIFVDDFTRVNMGMKIPPPPTPPHSQKLLQRSQ
uniref:Uncharacterized protein n=1 Tax=Nelumbo nucifera TaxID=4432 RepID=A0A822XXA2_NELNU|nr:TPA_asm: hypothetical protein HUJ06_025109 [Nelumbo nucifera]